jgi:hypothetical protein
MPLNEGIKKAATITADNNIRPGAGRSFINRKFLENNFDT